MAVNAFYARMQATALRQVKKYGTLVPYKQNSGGGGDYDPTTGMNAINSGTNSFNRLALLTDQAGNRINPKDGAILDDGSLIQGGDKWLYFVTDKPRPVLQDQVTVQGITYSIKDVQIYGPGGIDLLYLCVVRQ